MKNKLINQTLAFIFCLFLLAGCAASDGPSAYEVKNAEEGIDIGTALKVSFPGKTAPEGSSRDESDMNPGLRSWILRANAIFYVDDELDFDRTMIAGGDPQDEAFRKTIKGDLADNSIRSRESLQDEVNKLITSGCYVKSQRLLKKLQKDDLLTLSQEEMESYAQKHSRHYEYTATYNTYQRSGDSLVMAWDYLRALNRLGRGYGAGYITFDEYEAAALPIALRLQESYASFEDIDYAYNQGYLFCNGYSTGKVDDTFARREEIAKRLKSEETVSYDLPASVVAAPQ